MQYAPPHCDNGVTAAAYAQHRRDLRPIECKFRLALMTLFMAHWPSSQPSPQRPNELSPIPGVPGQSSTPPRVGTECELTRPRSQQQRFIDSFPTLSPQHTLHNIPPTDHHPSSAQSSVHCAIYFLDHPLPVGSRPVCSSTSNNPLHDQPLLPLSPLTHPLLRPMKAHSGHLCDTILDVKHCWHFYNPLITWSLCRVGAGTLGRGIVWSLGDKHIGVGRGGLPRPVGKQTPDRLV